jgi:hypothetical protein
LLLFKRVPCKSEKYVDQEEERNLLAGFKRVAQNLKVFMFGGKEIITSIQ